MIVLIVTFLRYFFFSSPPKKGPGKIHFDMCRFCFDVIKKSLDKEYVLLVPSSLQKDSRIRVYVQWSRISAGNGKKKVIGRKFSTKNRPIAEALQKAALDSAFNDPKTGDTVTAEDVAAGKLECMIRITKEMVSTSFDAKDWVLGQNGFVMTVNTASGKALLNTVIMPDRPEKEGWSKSQTVKYLEEKAKNCIAALQGKGRSKQEKGEIEKSTTSSSMNLSSSSGENKASSGTGKESAGEKVVAHATLKSFTLTDPIVMSSEQYSKSGRKSNSSTVIFGLIIVMIAMVWLRYAESTYDVNYDEFLLNYEILGVPPLTPLPEVKKAWRSLGKKYHPDKNKNCDSCADMYVKISEAYTQISDYEKGKLKLVGEDRHQKGSSRRK